MGERNAHNFPLALHHASCLPKRHLEAASPPLPHLLDEASQGVALLRNARVALLRNARVALLRNARVALQAMQCTPWPKGVPCIP
jgi:hypothetical protein